MNTDAEDRSDRLEVKLRGPSVTIEDTFKAGLALKDLLGSVAESLGAPEGAAGAWQVVAVAFQCDGCGLRRPDRPAPGEGWTYRDGDDLCPSCAAAVVSGGSCDAGDAPEETR